MQSLIQKLESFTGKVKASSRRSPEKRCQQTTNAIQLVIGGGTTGASFIDWFVGRNPEYAETVVSADGEPRSDREHEPPYKISTAANPNVRQLVEYRHLHPIIDTDPLTSTLDYPWEIGAGAGGTRIMGCMKFATALHEYNKKVANAVHAALDDFPGDRLETVRLAFVGGASGGQNSGMLLPAILAARHAASRLAPGATVAVNVHLLNQTCYEKAIADPAKLTRLAANAEALYKELEFGQHPPNLAPLCAAMGLPPIDQPPIDQLTVYHSTDTRGCSYPLPQDNFPRIRANILAEASEAVAGVFVARDRCNHVTQTFGQERAEERVVASTQARIAAVPPILHDAFAATWTLHFLGNLLAAPDANRVKASAAKAHEMLRLNTAVRDTIHKAYHQIEIDTNVKTRPQDLARTSNSDAIAQLRLDHNRFNSTVADELHATQQKILRHFETRVVPETINGIIDELVRATAGVEEIRAVLEAVSDLVVDDSRRLDGHIARLVQDVGTKRQKYSAELEKLIREDYFWASKRRRLAAEANVAHQQASLKVAFYNCMHDVLGLFAQHLAARVGQLRQVSEAIQDRQARMKDYGRALKRIIETDPLLVIAPDEAKQVVKRLTDLYKVSTGRGVEPIDFKAILEAGVGEIDFVINAYFEKLRDGMRLFFKGEIPDISTFVQKMQLRFNLASFLEETLRTLGRSAPLELAHIGVVVERTLVVAAGRDYELAKQTLAKDPARYENVELVLGADGLTLSVSRRIDGLPLSALPARKDAQRAAAKYPMPRAGLAIGDTLISTGHLLGAYGVDPATIASPGESYADRLRDRAIGAEANGHHTVAVERS